MPLAYRFAEFLVRGGKVRFRRFDAGLDNVVTFDAPRLGAWRNRQAKD